LNLLPEAEEAGAGARVVAAAVVVMMTMQLILSHG
jgi:hypothetical protein